MSFCDQVRNNSGKPAACLLGGMPPKILQQLKDRGVFRCASVVPDCRSKPVGNFFDGGKMHRLFCEKHLRMFCERAGIAYPEPEN